MTPPRKHEFAEVFLTSVSTFDIISSLCVPATLPRKNVSDCESTSGRSEGKKHDHNNCNES